MHLDEGKVARTMLTMQADANTPDLTNSRRQPRPPGDPAAPAAECIRRMNTRMAGAEGCTRLAAL